MSSAANTSLGRCHESRGICRQSWARSGMLQITIVNGRECCATSHH
ncbi:MAG TPA: hypothetical protein VEC39_19515 [Vicinamibacterales bacterium]|nr:hypothetical protein [Vicinamibacterales bacterium]